MINDKMDWGFFCDEHHFSHISRLFSSDPSPQLSTLSHRRHLGIHLLFWQRNRVLGSHKMLLQTASSSSDLSPQSSLPSQRQSLGMQIYMYKESDENWYNTKFLQIRMHSVPFMFFINERSLFSQFLSLISNNLMIIQFQIL